MMVNKTPPTAQMDEAIALVREARNRLMIARKVRAAEIARRVAELKAQIELDVDAEIAAHEESLSVALINAYDAKASIRRISMEAFDSPFDLPVRRIFDRLREDGRWAPRGRLSGRGIESGDDVLTMPEVLSIEDVRQAGSLRPPTFTFVESGRLLAEFGDVKVVADVVELKMDPRDPFFEEIASNIRPGSTHATATMATLYRHAATKRIVALESNETGESMVDHPVARWAKNHATDVERYFEAALAAGVGGVVAYGDL